MSQITEDIKSRLDIVDIVSEYLPLNQAGSNFRALCPFHKEKTPSFMVSSDKQIFHCFGCGVSGDIFEFIMKMEGIEFPEALRMLADKANVKIDYNYNPDLSNKKTKVLDILKESENYYHELLLQSDNAQIAREYLENRGITKEAIDTFNLGYSNESWDDLYNYLKNKKFTDSDVESAGMIIKSDKGYKFYDRFRNRLMFPINNSYGQIVGFTARILKSDENQAKYINTPQTAVYDKSSVLFNLDLAKQEIKRKNYTILVEGNIDVISSYMAGVKNVVASSGTALTLNHVKLLKRYSENLIIAYDGDSAGLKATFRIIDNALLENMNIKIISLPKEVDPDNLIKQDPNKWILAIKSAEPIMDFVFRKILSSVDLTNVFSKKQVTKKLLIFMSKFRDEIERETYINKLSDAINIDRELLKKKLSEFMSKKIVVEEKEGNYSFKPIHKNKKEEFLKKIIALGVSFSSILEYLSSNLELEFVGDGAIEKLYKSTIIYYTKNNSFELESLRLELDNEQNELLNAILFVLENEFGELDKNQAYLEVQSLVLSYKKLSKDEEAKRKEYELKQAERDGDSEKANEILEELNKIKKYLNNLK